jgi:hypothetical protein
MAKSFDDMVEALEYIADTIDNNSTVSFSTDDYNMLAFIGENLHEIANTLKKIEAKLN